MTVLQRTDLTTSQKIQCAAAAVAGQHAHGSCQRKVEMSPFVQSRNVPFGHRASSPPTPGGTPAVVPVRPWA